MTRTFQISLFLVPLLLAGAGWLYSIFVLPAAFTVTQLASTSARPFSGGGDIRLGGVAMYGTVEADPSGLTRFVMTDCRNDLSVEYTGVLPASFREGGNVILTGTLDVDNIFRARTLRPHRGENCDPAVLAAPLAPQQAG